MECLYFPLKEDSFVKEHDEGCLDEIYCLSKGAPGLLNHYFDYENDLLLHSGYVKTLKICHRIEICVLEGDSLLCHLSFHLQTDLNFFG